MKPEASSLHPFVRSLATVRFVDCFNPYSDRCLVHDRLDAPQQRANLLSAMLREAEVRGVDSIWIGRDLGYRGGRRTGLALTDDVHVHRHASRWGLPAALTTTGSAMSERTATVIWNVLDDIREGVFLWNVFPLHPHEPGTPFSNRQHNARERRAGEDVLGELVERLKPNRLIAIGNDATDAVRRLELQLPILSVRHPSYGGQTQFISQMKELYGDQAIGQRTLI